MFDKVISLLKGMCLFCSFMFLIGSIIKWYNFIILLRDFYPLKITKKIQFATAIITMAHEMKMLMAECAQAQNRFAQEVLKFTKLSLP